MGAASIDMTYIPCFMKIYLQVQNVLGGGGKDTGMIP